MINQNDKSVNLDTERFIEIDANGKIFTDIHTDKTYKWSGKIQIKNNSSFILTIKYFVISLNINFYNITI